MTSGTLTGDGDGHTHLRWRGRCLTPCSVPLGHSPVCLSFRFRGNDGADFHRYARALKNRLRRQSTRPHSHLRWRVGGAALSMRSHPIGTRRHPSAEKTAVDPTAITYGVAVVSPTAPFFGFHPAVGFAANRATNPIRAWWCGGADSARTLCGSRRLRWGPSARRGFSEKAPTAQGRRRFFGVLGKSLAHPAYRRGRTTAHGAGKGSSADCGRRVGFSHYWRLRTKGQACPFVPIGKGGFSLLVSRPTPPQAVNPRRSFADSALTPRRKHYILWCGTTPNTSSEKSFLTENIFSFIIRLRKALAPLIDSHLPRNGVFGAERLLRLRTVQECVVFFCPKKAEPSAQAGGVTYWPLCSDRAEGVRLPRTRGATEASM